ncbi:OsmC family peroxiredoxin [Flavobacterium sp. W1B]|uniref:OsmC family peroxiredoxin n=1 Tax=Flavobacterium sp. W1B TaxID=3394146 RepID=UPI0039BD03DA
MKSNIKAVWQGNFKEGKGQFNNENSKLDTITFKPSFAKNDGSFTNPEELLASAHASCYTMTLSYILSESGFSADNLETKIALEMENNVITRSNLILQAKIPAITAEKFQEIAIKAKGMCPVGNALSVEVSLEASLIQ